MKKIIFTILLIFSLSGCDLILNTAIDNVTLLAIRGQKLYNPGFPEMRTFQDVARYVNSVLEYDYGMSRINPIMDPQEAIESGRGICTTYSILFMNVAHFTLGIDFGFADADYGDSLQREVGIGGIPNHAMVILEGQLYSAYTGNKITDYEVSYYYDFDDVLN